MDASRRCYLFMELLGDYCRDDLEKISEGNVEVLAFMIAGAICYAEKYTGFECREEFQLELISTVFVALQELHEYPSKPDGTVLLGDYPSAWINTMATIAVLHYREIAEPGLGGNQTPCTVSAIKTSTNISVSPDLCGIPRISKMISKIRKIPKIMMSLLRISTISKD